MKCEPFITPSLSPGGKCHLQLPHVHGEMFRRFLGEISAVFVGGILNVKVED